MLLHRDQLGRVGHGVVDMSGFQSRLLGMFGMNWKSAMPLTSDRANG
jgi:hypothetical protein